MVCYLTECRECRVKGRNILAHYVGKLGVAHLLALCVFDVGVYESDKSTVALDDKRFADIGHCVELHLDFFGIYVLT